jgi:hypothetical protein
MLVRCKKTVDGITMGRFYEFKWHTSNNNVVIVNNRFQLIAYPEEYFHFENKKSKEVMYDNLRAMLKSKTFFTV